MGSRPIAALSALLVAGALLALAPLAPAAPSTRRSALESSPGYTPPNDPESLSVRLGRRPNAPIVSMPLTGGRDSLRGLVDAYLDAVARRDTASIWALCVTETEFDTILWREFPQSRPITGASAADGWYFLYRRLWGGVSRALNDHGGDTLTAVRIERSHAPDRYRNFTLHADLAVIARDTRGREVRLDDIRAVVERQGRYKIYSMKD